MLNSSNSILKHWLQGKGLQRAAVYDCTRRAFTQPAADSGGAPRAAAGVGTAAQQRRAEIPLWLRKSFSSTI